MDGSMRASDDDRRRTAEVLRHHAIQGRLTIEELATRLESVSRAVTHADLVALAADLPAGSASGWDQRIVSTGLIIAAAVIAGLILLGLFAMAAMMAFMGPAMGWNC